MIGTLAIDSNSLFEFGADFIVHDVEIDGMSTGLKAIHDIMIGWKTMMVGFCFIRFHENAVGAVMVGNHDVLVATTGFCGELTGAVEKQFVDWAVPNV